MRRRLITTLVAAAAALLAPVLLVGPAGAVPVARLGTPSSGISARANVDTFSNFIIVDVNQVAEENGWLTNIQYYAQATGTIQFLLVNSSNVIEWESGQIAVPNTGSETEPLPIPVAVRSGWRLGYWTEGSGVIPFDCPSGPNSSYEESGDDSGLGPVGSTVPVFGTGGCGSPTPPYGRTYSMGANIYPPYCWVAVPNIPHGHGDFYHYAWECPNSSP
jgi:hypothetical protein